MRKPAELLLPHYLKRGRQTLEEVVPNPVAVLEEYRQPTEVIGGKVKLGRFGCARYSLEVPHEAIDDTVELHGNGLAAAKPSYRRVRRVSSGRGQISASISPERGTVVGDLLHPQTLFHAEKYQVESMLAVLEDIERRFGLSLVKLRSHSMNGRAGVAVAEAAPEKIENLTLVNAPGLEEHDFLEMLSRLKGFVNGELRPNMGMLYQEFHEPQVVIDFMCYIMQNPLRTGIEAYSISRADIRDRVRNLGAHSIAVSILDTQADSLVPNKTVENTIGREVAHYSMHPNPLIGHLGPQTHPTEMIDEYHLADQAVQTWRSRVSYSELA